MLYELVYTSSPQGLRPGTSGLTTVAQTEGIPAALADALEAVSLYQHRIVGRNLSSSNPTILNHLLYPQGHRIYHILSRIVDAGLDATNRGNYLAHHFLLEGSAVPAGDSIRILQNKSEFYTEWSKASKPLAPRPELKAKPLALARCHYWKSAFGDAGWAGVLAAKSEPVYVVVGKNFNTHELIAEALALRPAHERWSVSYSTYFLGVPPGVQCQWRFMPDDAPQLAEFVAQAGARLLRMDRDLPPELESPLVTAARTGEFPMTAAVPEMPRVREPEGYDLPVPMVVRAEPVRVPQMEMVAARELPVTPRSKPLSLPTPGGFAVKTLLLGLALGAGLALMLLGVSELALKKSTVESLGLAADRSVLLEERSAEITAIKGALDSANATKQQNDTRAKTASADRLVQLFRQWRMREQNEQTEAALAASKTASDVKYAALVKQHQDATADANKFKKATEDLTMLLAVANAGPAPAAAPSAPKPVIQVTVPASNPASFTLTTLPVPGNYQINPEAFPVGVSAVPSTKGDRITYKRGVLDIAEVRLKEDRSLVLDVKGRSGEISAASLGLVRITKRDDDAANKWGEYCSVVVCPAESAKTLDGKHSETVVDGYWVWKLPIEDLQAGDSDSLLFSRDVVVRFHDGTAANDRIRTIKCGSAAGEKELVAKGDNALAEIKLTLEGNHLMLRLKDGPKPMPQCEVRQLGIDRQVKGAACDRLPAIRIQKDVGKQ